MKNNKKLKNNEQLILAAGVFKKRMWPWLFVILAAVIAAACYALIAVEYFFGTKVCETCTSYFTYTRHYYQFVNLTLIVVAALIVIAILCAIIFLRKRTLTVSTTQITDKKGRKTIDGRVYKEFVVDELVHIEEDISDERMAELLEKDFKLTPNK